MNPDLDVSKVCQPVTLQHRELSEMPAKRQPSLCEVLVATDVPEEWRNCQCSPSARIGCDSGPVSMLANSETIKGRRPTGLFISCEMSSYALRAHIPRFIFLALVSPLRLNIIDYSSCAAILLLSYGVPPLVRLWWPLFMTKSILDELDTGTGAMLGLCGSFTAILLQIQDPRIAFAVKTHAGFYSRPLVRLLRTFLYVELALNGSSEEQDQTASWLTQLHRHVRGSIDEKTRKEWGIDKNLADYGFMDELKVYVMETLTWSTIAFEERFGRRLSDRAKDSIVLEFSCAAMRLGVPRSMVSSDHEGFLTSFDRRHENFSSRLTTDNTHAFEVATLRSRTHPVTHLFLHLGLLIGHSVLPERLKCRFPLAILESRWGRATQRFLCFVLWLVYPCLISLPLRGMICMLLIFEPPLRRDLQNSLNSIRRIGKNTGPATSSFLTWLATGRRQPPFLQMLLVRTLETQVEAESQSGIGCLDPWLRYPFSITRILAEYSATVIPDAVSQMRVQVTASAIFRSTSVKLPHHIGVIMDGNRRYARQIGQPVLAGHARGATTASQLLQWWVKYLPNNNIPAAGQWQPTNLTCWAFSSDNFQRPESEREGLFELMSTEFKTLAFTGFVHLYRIRVRFIGQRDELPDELRKTMHMVEALTADYDALFLQIAVGYGGRREVVDAVQNLINTDREVTEENIGLETYRGQMALPPVDLIIRTSERRTSGFVLWDMPTAELHFIDKLWPQLTQRALITEGYKGQCSGSANSMSMKVHMACLWQEAIVFVAC
ncbi:putative undecaprenyl diphosphate synthase-domain-containing protein [Mycena amicta]|nr:putative undecaprenyl diphosphate synthase-domain-containing protein [Mycena amicta]